MNTKIKYTIEHANEVLNVLKRNNIKAITIGSIARSGHSYNDIDILILNMGESITDTIEKVLINIFKPYKTERTDWNGLYLYYTEYGNIDVFFTTKDFDY